MKANGINFTIKCRTTDLAFGELDREYNRLVCKWGSLGERPHAVIKRVFGEGRVLITMIQRVYVKMVVIALASNLNHICIMKCKSPLNIAKLSKDSLKRQAIQTNWVP